MCRILPFAIILTCLARLSSFADDFDAAGVNIHYTVQGRGEPVILIHGLFVNGVINWGFPGITAALAERAEVIVMDCRGHGLSGKPTGEHDYGLKMVEDVGRLMDHLQLKSAHLIGYSMGAMITLKFASLHPERVRSATLGGSGWMEDGSIFQRLADGAGDAGASAKVFRPVVAGFADFAVPAQTMKALQVPIEIVVGEKDPARALAIAPLLQLRPDLTEHVIADADHLTTVLKSEFRTQILAALERHLDVPQPALKNDAEPSDKLHHP